MSAAQSIQNQDNTFALLSDALKAEPKFKLAGREYIDTTGKIPAGHATILAWVRPYDDETESHTGFVLDETPETLTVGLSGVWRFTGHKQHVIITRSAL